MIELKNYSSIISNLVKEKIILHCRRFKVNAEICNLLCNIFEHYSPNKERGYIINVISSAYGLSKETSLFLESGVELIFASYYLKDDLLDDVSDLFGELNTRESNKKFTLVADMLVELGNREIALYCDHVRGTEGALFSGIFSMVYGQYLGLKLGAATSIEQYFQVAHNKNGVMVKSAIEMLRPIIGNKIDFEVLESFACSFGVGSQIRNDIEDFFLREDFGKPFRDFMTNQTNFVLSLHYERTRKSSDFISKKEKPLDEILLSFSEDLMLGLAFLDAFKNDLIKKLSLLSNAECKKKLESIVRNTLVIM